MSKMFDFNKIKVYWLSKEAYALNHTGQSMFRLALSLAYTPKKFYYDAKLIKK